MTDKMIGITETVLRDAHQSLMATRMSTNDMLPIIEKMDKVGYFSLECWGGATFDAAIRFLNEDPWDRLRQVQMRAPNTNLCPYFAGQISVNYTSYFTRNLVKLQRYSKID
nr:hypothetical protein [Vibrio coralliilyticus]